MNRRKFLGGAVTIAPALPIAAKCAEFIVPTASRGVPSEVVAPPTVGAPRPHPIKITVVNTIDPGKLLSTEEGQRAIIDVIRGNAKGVRRMLTP